MAQSLLSTPVRPRRLGELLDDSFRVYVAQFRYLVVVALCTYLPDLLVSGWAAARWNVGDPFVGVKSREQMIAALSAAVPKLVPLTIVTGLSGLIFGSLFYGTVIRRVTAVKTGEDTVSVADGLRHAGRRLLAVIGTDLLKAAALLIVGVGGAVILGGAAMITPSPGLQALLGIVLTVAWLALLIWLVIRWCFATYAAFEEGVAGVSALQTSWRYVQEGFWRVFGYLLLVQLLVSAVGYGIDLAARLIPATWLTIIVQGAVSLLSEPFVAVAVTILYLDVRVRYEQRQQFTS